MALTYEKVLGVISQAPSNRKDFEVNNLLSWFRKKSELFRNLKQELLFDLIKNLNFVTKQRDELVIKQFDYGDTMYILLRGTITIFILYPKKIEDDSGEETSKPQQMQLENIEGSPNIRQQLGTFVTNLGPGATFGEIALLKEDPEECKRTASIIANETVDLIEIDRNLYNRSVKNVLKQEFEDKSNFIANNPFFQNWLPKFRKQLAMALQIEVFQYDSIIAKQGDPIEAIYFILRGEAKVTMDPELHKKQYPKYFDYHYNPLASSNSHDDFDHVHRDKIDHIKAMSDSARQRSNSESATSSKLRHKTHRKHPLEVCLLGVNECIGDIEVLMELETSLQTTKCTSRTEVLVLEMKHYERLLVKRNPKTIKNMKECLDLRLKSRMKDHEDELPLLKGLFYEVVEFASASHGQTSLKRSSSAKAKGDKGKTHNKKVEEYFTDFIPPPGALIDMHGPGTVFHRIREREKLKEMKRQKGEGGVHKHNYVAGGGGYSTSPQTARSMMTQHHDQISHSPPSIDVDPMTSDPALRDLEERMRNWLQNEGQTTSRSTPRVSKMHRKQVDEETLKPGAKVVFRPKATTNGFLSQHINNEIAQEESSNLILHSNSWSRHSSSRHRPN